MSTAAAVSPATRACSANVPSESRKDTHLAVGDAASPEPTSGIAAQTGSEPALPLYILRWRLTSYSLVGPFESDEAAVAWGRADQAADRDNPCWNTIRLFDADLAPAVYPPSTAPGTI